MTNNQLVTGSNPVEARFWAPVCIFLCALLILFPVSTAEAGWKIDRATEIAEAVWHNPCGGHVRMSWADKLPDDAIGYAPPHQCEIVLSRSYDMFWSFFCTVVVHEYGHVAGMGHSTYPYSVMYSRAGWDATPDGIYYGGGVTIDGVYYPARNPGGDPRCLNRGRTYLDKVRPGLLN